MQRKTPGGLWNLCTYKELLFLVSPVFVTSRHRNKGSRGALQVAQKSICLSPRALVTQTCLFGTLRVALHTNNHEVTLTLYARTIFPSRVVLFLNDPLLRLFLACGTRHSASYERADGSCVPRNTDDEGVDRELNLLHGTAGW